MALGTPQKALTGDGGLVISVFVSERNKGVRCRDFTGVFVGKRAGFTATTDRSGIAPASWFAKVVESGLVGFVDVELANGLNCPAHDGNFRLTESVDALFHIADNAHGWVPCTERS